MNTTTKKRTRKSTKADSLYNHLYENLKSGFYNGKLPSVKQLTEDFNVHHATVAKAMKRLSEEGVIYKQERVGSFANRKNKIGFLMIGSEQDAIYKEHYILMYEQLISGCNKAADEEYMPLRILFAHPAEEKKIEQFINDVDGIVLYLFKNIAVEDLHFLEGVKKVRVLGSLSSMQNFPHITYNNQIVGKIAAEHLIAQGCTKFITVGPPPNNIIKDRYDVFANHVKERGFNTNEVYCDPFYIPQAEFITQLSDSLKSLLKSEEKIGIFSVVDIMLNSLYQTILRLGYLPENFEIISCNNDSHYAKALFPPPAEIDIRFGDIGYDAVKMVIKMLKKNDDGDDFDNIIKTPKIVSNNQVYSMSGFIIT